MPGHSPGARIQDGVGTSSRDEPVRRAPVGRRVHHAGGRGGLLGELLDRRGLLDHVVGDRGEPAVARRRRAGPAGSSACGSRRARTSAAGSAPASPAGRPRARPSRRARRAAAACPWSRSRRRRARRSTRTCSGSSPNTCASVPRVAGRALGRVVERRGRRPVPQRDASRAAPSGCCGGRRRVGRVDPTSAAPASAASTSPCACRSGSRVDLLGLVEPRVVGARARRRAARRRSSTRTQRAASRAPPRASRRPPRRRSGRGRRRAATGARRARPSAVSQPRARSRARARRARPATASAARRRPRAIAPRATVACTSAHVGDARRPGARRRSAPRR